jgi:hypothetical protein
MSRIALPLILVLAASWVLSGCSSSPSPSTTVVATPASHSGHGPPPHAPAHGYRHKHGDGAELVYDAGLDVYLVVGMKGRYYREGNYYCRRGNEWLLSSSLRGPWKIVGKSHVPAGLRHGSKKSKEIGPTAN